MSLPEDPETHAARERYGAGYDRVVALLFLHDPIGLAPTDPNEYRAEAVRILPLLESARSVADVRHLTHQVFVRMFDPSLAGPENEYASLAQALWQVWQTR